MRHEELLKELPGQPKIPGRLLNVGDKSGDMYRDQLSEIATFSAVGTLMREHEHRYAWAYKPPYPFIYNQVAPAMPVGAIHTDYRYWAERTFFDRPAVAVTRTSHPTKIRLSNAVANIDLTGRALAIEFSKVDLADAVSQYGSEQNFRNVLIKVLKALIELDLELEVATLFQTQSNFATNYYGTLAAGDFAARPYWSDTASLPLSDVLGAVNGQIGSSGKLYGMWDTLIVGRDVDYNLKVNVSDVKSAVAIQASDRSAARPLVQDAAISQYFGTGYIVGKSQYNSTPESDTPTMSDIWGKYAVACQLAGALGGDDLAPAFARIAYLNSQQVPNYQGWSVRSVRDEMMGGIGGEILVVAYWAMPIIISQKLAWNLKVLA